MFLTYLCGNVIMTTENDILLFLQDFHMKVSMWGIVFRDDRGKNTQTLFDLEITRNQRLEILKTLSIKDYSEGPLEEKLHNGADMWVFGKIVKEKEVYIKITMGMTGVQAICISFHISEHPMNYPFKTTTK